MLTLFCACKKHLSSQYMNSANQKSRTLADRSPWSDDKGGRRSPRRPPRSPASPYIYHEGTVSSPAFDSLGTRTRRKREVRTNTDTQTPQQSPEALTPKAKSLASPEKDSTFTSPATTTTTLNKKQACSEQKLPTRNYSATPTFSTPSVNSQASNSDQVSILSASSQVFVPSEFTLANLSDQKSTTHSTDSPSSRFSNRTSKRFPEGDELKNMVEVLLMLIDNGAKATKTSPTKKVWSLYPVLPNTAAKYRNRRTHKGRSADDSILVSNTASCVSARRRTRSE